VGGSGKTEILMQAAVNCVMPRRRGRVGCHSSPRYFAVKPRPLDDSRHVHVTKSDTPRSECNPSTVHVTNSDNPPPGVMQHNLRDGDVDFGGCESSVLLVDLDGKFDTLRLLKILTTRIQAAVANAAASQTKGPEQLEALNDQVYVDCMGRFQMLRCHSSLDFLKALSVVERIFTVQEEKIAAATGGGGGGGGGGNNNNNGRVGTFQFRPLQLAVGALALGLAPLFTTLSCSQNTNDDSQCGPCIQLTPSRSDNPKQRRTAAAQAAAADRQHRGVLLAGPSVAPRAGRAAQPALRAPRLRR
jgi:hypothetical protein